ncbi:MAG: hypothetical protein ACFFD4_12655 [Candidatus Odinarchaeota archaeon]
MEKLIFTCLINFRGAELGAVLLTESIRRFAGTLSDCPVWALVPESEDNIAVEVREQLSSLGVQIFPYTADPDVLKFPFAGLVLAAATAESLAKEKTEFLAWMLPDTVVLNEPRHFLLDEGTNLGYRPVHHTLVGSIYGKPVDPFWELVYRKCNVSEDKIFPMKTHVDHNTLRPYFNAGCLVVRPERGLLQSWWSCFKELYHDPGFEEFYKKNRLYSIFIHQAVLAGVILSTMEKQELEELPFNYNYPLHLYEESPVEYRPQNVNDLITARYEKPQWLTKMPFEDPLKSWITDQLDSLAKNKT